MYLVLWSILRRSCTPSPPDSTEAEAVTSHTSGNNLPAVRSTWLSVTVSASSRPVRKDSHSCNRSRCLSLLVGKHARKIESSPWAWCKFVKNSSKTVAFRTRSSANETVELSLPTAEKPSTTNGLSESISETIRSGPTPSFWFANCIHSEHFASLIVRSAKYNGCRSKSNALITSSRIPKRMPSSAYYRSRTSRKNVCRAVAKHESSAIEQSTGPAGSYCCTPLNELITYCSKRRLDGVP